MGEVFLQAETIFMQTNKGRKADLPGTLLYFVNKQAFIPNIITLREVCYG